MSEAKSNPEQLVSIALPDKYWVVLLAMLQDYTRTAAPRLKELQAQGDAFKKLAPGDVTALVGPIIARGMIVKALTEAGVSTKEAEDAVGVDRLMEMAKRFNPEN